MSLHRQNYLQLLGLIQAAVETVQQTMPGSAGAAKLAAATNIVTALAPTAILQAEQLKAAIAAVADARKGAGGDMNPTTK